MSSSSLLKTLRRDVRRYDRVMDALRIALSYSHPRSCLPELCEVLPLSEMAAFLDRFGGTSIAIPPATELRAVFEDVESFLRIESGKESVEDSAVRRGITNNDARERYERIRTGTRRKASSASA